MCVWMKNVVVFLFQDKAVVQRLERLCDTVVRIESFAGSEKEKNPVFKDYHGKSLEVKSLPFFMCVHVIVFLTQKN